MTRGSNKLTNNAIYIAYLKGFVLNKLANSLTWLTKYPPFSDYGRQFLFHYDNQKYWSFWEKMVKGWYQIWIKGWEKDNYFIYFYCGLDYPRRKGRVEEVQKYIDKQVGKGVAEVGNYQNQTLTIRVLKSYFAAKKNN